MRGPDKLPQDMTDDECLDAAQAHNELMREIVGRIVSQGDYLQWMMAANSVMVGVAMHVARAAKIGPHKAFTAMMMESVE